MCIAAIFGLQDVVLPESPFLFAPSTDLPEGISIEYFMGETKQTGEYQIIVKKASNRPIVLPRGANLGSIEQSCQVIEKVDISDSVDLAPNDDTIPDKFSAPQVDPLYQQPLENCWPTTATCLRLKILNCVAQG